MLKQVSDTLLAPSNLSHQSLLNIFDVMSHRHIDYADLYFQLSQDESWVLEDSEEFSPQAVKALTLIAKELPLKKAAAIVAELYGYKKNALYQFGLDNLD